jgi:hypothetical protein
MANRRNWVASDGRILTARSISTDLDSRVLRGELRLWDGVTGRALGPTVNVEGSCDQVALSDDGRRLAVTGLFGGLSVIDPVAGRILFSRHVGSEEIAGLTFAEDGRLLTVGSDGMGRTRDAVTGTPAGAQVRYGESARHAAFSADGRRVVTMAGIDEALIQVWDVATGEAVARPLRLAPEACVELNSDGSRLLTWESVPTRPGTARL